MLERKGEVAYHLGLPPNLSGVHDVFHVSQLKKCLRLLEERVPWYGLDDTGISDLHRASGEDIGDIWESYLGQEDQDLQNAMEWPHREDEPMKTYPDLFASQPRILGRDSCKGVGFVTP